MNLKGALVKRGSPTVLGFFTFWGSIPLGSYFGWHIADRMVKNSPMSETRKTVIRITATIGGGIMASLVMGSYLGMKQYQQQRSAM